MALDPTTHVYLQDPFGAPVNGKSQPLASPWRLIPLGDGPMQSQGVPYPNNALFPESRLPIAAPSAPTVTAGGTGGTIGTGNAYTKLHFITDLGSTTPSAQTTTAITSGQVLTVTVPAFPQGVNACVIDVSTTTNTETVQQIVNAPGTYTVAAISAGAAIPTANTSIYNPFSVANI
jgi:hypothetical protein